MENLRRTHQIASAHKIPVYLDACRFAQNAWFIHEREPGYRSASIRGIVAEMCSYVDGCIFSAKKDGLGHMGGFLSTRSASVAAKARDLLLLSEGYLTYGGMTGRDMEIVATGLQEVLEEDYLQYRAGTTEYLWRLLREQQVPVLSPPGGHAVYIDANSLLPHLSTDENPGQSLAAAIYLEAGIRTTKMILPREREFVRLAIPSRVYSSNHLAYVAQAVGRVARNAAAVKGLRTVAPGGLLGGFVAEYETVRQAVKLP
jgi:tryptophanase